MKIYIIIIALLLGNLVSQAQTPDLLESEGKIPREFTTSSTDKYKTQLNNLKKKSKSKKGKKNKKATKNKKEFLLESNFAIDDILQSGLVLFNDPATKYVNKVLKKLPTKRSRSGKSNPKAYVLNSPAVNAFATDQGYIFVTLGLLANLENEAQLAFILAHELIHFYHGHSIDKFIHSKDVARESKNFNFSKNKGNLTLDQKLFKESLYSRKIEEEADEEGYEIFKKTNYDDSTLPNVFRILHYSYLPFEDLPFERSFFETKDYIFPDQRWIEKINDIKPMETTDDKLSSHPASAKRLSKIKKQITNSNTENKKLYIVGESEFKTIQQKARYQIPFLNLYDHNFPEAIYTSFLQLKENDTDIELKKVVGKSLYMHAKYLNYSEEYELNYSENYKEVAREIQGESHRVYHLLARMDHKEALVLAMKYNWNLLKEKPKDSEIQGFLDDLFMEFASVFDDLDEFSSTARPINSGKDEEQVEESVDSNQISTKKNDKIKSIAKDMEYWQYGLVDIVKEASFKKEFSSGKKSVKKRQRITDSYDTESGRKKLIKESKREYKKGKGLGIKKVVVINPYYLSVSEDKNENTEVEYLRSEEKQQDFNKYISSLGKKAKLKVEVLDVASLKSNDVETFNDIAKANQYFSQQMDQYDLSLTPGFQQFEMDKLAKKYGTDYFLWTGVISLKENETGEWARVFASLFLPYFLPFTLYDAFTPDYDMFYYAIIFDVTTGRRSIIKTDFYNNRDSKTMIKSHVYDTYHQIYSRAK